MCKCIGHLHLGGLAKRDWQAKWQNRRKPICRPRSVLHVVVLLSGVRNGPRSGMRSNIAPSGVVARRIPEYTVSCLRLDSILSVPLQNFRELQSCRNALIEQGLP
jgi:hypothetical protein